MFSFIRYIFKASGNANADELMGAERMEQSTIVWLHIPSPMLPA